MATLDSSAVSWGQLSRFDGPLKSPGFILWRDFMRWQRELNGLLKPYGITQPQFAVLACCAWMTREADAVQQTKLVETLGLDKMHVSQVVGRLEDVGLLLRKGAREDLRVKQLSLSEKAQEMLAKCFPIVEGHDAGFFAEASSPTPSARPDARGIR
jgi:DNA-binding MarR family transcriptional regulator